MKLKHYQEKREMGIYDKRNKINDLTGKEWLFSTRSVKTKDYQFHFDIEKALRNNFFNPIPVELLTKLIDTFSKPNSTILDINSNFGSCALATYSSTRKYNYFGFNLTSNKVIDIDELSQHDFVELSTNRIKVNCFQQTSNIPLTICSELIFSSTKTKIRIREFEHWAHNTIEDLNLILNSKYRVGYIIIILQNTKAEDSYINHIYKLFKMLNNENIILKAELIWKIPKIFLDEIVSILEQMGLNSNQFSPITNEKRILVYRYED